MVLKGHRETGLKICSVDSKNAVSDNDNVKLIKSAIQSFKNVLYSVSFRSTKTMIELQS